MAAQENKKVESPKDDSWERSGRNIRRWMEMKDPIMSSDCRVMPARQSKYGCTDRIEIATSTYND